MIGAILFDVDGTLIDSNQLHVEAWREAFLHFGIDIDLDRIHAQIGKGGDNLIPALLPADIVERCQKDIETFRSELFLRDYLHRTRAFPDVRPLFERLAADGIRIVLASSAKQAEIDHHVETLGCADLIDAVTSRDDVEHSKPCPDIFAAALAKVAPLGASDVLVVGDTPYDVEAARRIGIASVALRSGGFSEAALLDAGAVLLFDGISDLLSHYGRLFEPLRGAAPLSGNQSAEPPVVPA
jgi:HAD superfamily hydrolase (TIGR01549 family)